MMGPFDAESQYDLGHLGASVQATRVRHAGHGNSSYVGNSL